MLSTGIVLKSCAATEWVTRDALHALLEEAS